MDEQQLDDLIALTFDQWVDHYYPTAADDATYFDVLPALFTARLTAVIYRRTQPNRQ